MSQKIRKLIALAARLAARGRRSRADRAHQYHVTYSKLYYSARRSSK